MPTKREVRDRLSRLLHEIGGIALDRITDTATIEDELQMSSLAFVELQVALEEEYQIQVDPIHVVELGSFGAIVEYVHQVATATPS